MSADVSMISCSFDGEMATYGGTPKDLCSPDNKSCLIEEQMYGVAAYVLKI